MTQSSVRPRPFRAFGITATILFGAVGLTVACDSITAPKENRNEKLRPAERLVPSASIGVSPGAMQGWAFYNDQTGAACGDTLVCRMVSGPAGQSVPLGSGSAELATATTSDGKALILASFQGTRFSDIGALRYSTLRQTSDAGNNLAIALQFNVDYDLADALAGYQGRIVFEPYQGASGAVLSGVWQEWDTKAGKWWGTKATVSRNGGNVANPCVQSSPCTWTQLLAQFPNLGVHATYGALVLKAGSGWQLFRGNVDKLVITVSGVTTTYDFELVAAQQVPAHAPDSVPSLIEDMSQYVEVDAEAGMSVHRSVFSLEFHDTTSLSTRSAVIASVGGQVVGGEPDPEDGDGPYFVRIADDPTGDSILARAATRAQRPGVAAAYGLVHYSADSSLGYRRPRDGAAWAQWEVDPSKMKFAHGGRALEAIRAPMAWGCETGSSSTKVAVIDNYFHSDTLLKGNRLSTNYRDLLPAFTLDPKSWHGDAVSQVLAAYGNDSSGMTGVMWRAGLRQYDMAIVSQNATGSAYVLNENFKAVNSMRVMRLALIDAARKGSRVVNMSMFKSGTTLPRSMTA